MPNLEAQLRFTKAWRLRVFQDLGTSDPGDEVRKVQMNVDGRNYSSNQEEEAALAGIHCVAC